MSNLLEVLWFVTRDLLVSSDLRLNRTPCNDTSICIQYVLCEIPDAWYKLYATLGCSCGLLPAKDQVSLFSPLVQFVFLYLCALAIVFAANYLLGVLHVSFNTVTCSKVLYVSLSVWLHVPKLISLGSFQWFPWNTCGVALLKLSNVIFPLAKGKTSKNKLKKITLIILKSVW